MLKTNKCIISFANRNGDYMQRLARLSDSLRNNWDGDFLAFVGESSCGSPLHEEIPYAFKIHCISKAIYAGYTQILWLDTSCFAVKNVQSVFDHITKYGHIAQESGYFLSEWCNDETLKYFNLTREKASTIKMIGNAGFLGIDITTDKGLLFFNEWNKSMVEGMFLGGWENHRHDMSCSSAIWHKLEMDIQPGNEWVQYAGIYDELLNDKIVFKAQG